MRALRPESHPRRSSRTETTPGDTRLVFGIDQWDSDRPGTSFPLLASLCSAGSAVLGAALCYIRLDGRNGRSRVSLALAHERTREVLARYKANVTMEGRVTRVIRDFDRAETTLQSKLTDQIRQMLRLRQALDAHEGVTTTFEQREPAMRSNAPLGALIGEGVEEVAAFEDELVSWRQRAAHAQADNEAELFRQTTAIDRLTARLESLEPEKLAGIGAERDAELARHTERSAQLREERDRLDAEVKAQERRLSRVSGDLDLKKTALAQSRTRFKELDKDLGKQITQLRRETEERTNEIRGLEEQLCTAKDDGALSRKEVSALDSRLAERKKEIRTLESKIEEVTRTLEATNQRSGQQGSRIEALMSALDAANEMLDDSPCMLAKKGSAMSAGASMLANLKPMMEALEGPPSEEEKAERKERSARSRLRVIRRRFALEAARKGQIKLEAPGLIQYGIFLRLGG